MYATSRRGEVIQRMLGFGGFFSLCAGWGCRWEMPLLRVGEEMKREKLSFRDGSSREYEVHGLRERQWYEIKISYPASVCLCSLHKSSYHIV